MHKCKPLGRTIYLNTVNIYSSLKQTDHDSHPYTTGNLQCTVLNGVILLRTKDSYFEQMCFYSTNKTTCFSCQVVMVRCLQIYAALSGIKCHAPSIYAYISYSGIFVMECAGTPFRKFLRRTQPERRS
jgi:hypothetical protein